MPQLSSVRILSRLLAIGLSTASVAPASVDYDRDIRPILSNSCFPCHGPDAGSRKAGLRLDVGEGAIASGMIVPGDATASELWRRITAADPDDRMPPPEAHLELGDEQRSLLRAWLNEGANYKPHWAFAPLPDSVIVPNVDDVAWVENPIDAFVLSRLEKEGVQPSPRAAKARWLRRVTYDLTGVPPTTAEMDAYLADKTSAASDTAVDRLLASPRFGERMAVPWLDAARYADSYGYQSDQLSPTWPYRDWVIRAFQENLPFDQFVTWQIAGDLLDEPTEDQRLATAFNRLHRMTNEGGSVDEEWRNEYAADRVHTFGTTFLGLTMECARCHDHKYDPISQRDYYQLFAFFNSIDEFGMYHDAGRVPTPSLLLPTDEQRPALEEAQSTVDEAIANLHRVRSESQSVFQAWRSSLSDNTSLSIPGLVAHYPLDDLVEGNRLENLADPKNPGSTPGANTIVEGRTGGSLRLSGDDAASFPNVVGRLGPKEAFTIAAWVLLPDDLTDGLILHRSGGTDVGYHGTELSVRDGHLRFSIARFWPGNAIAVRSDRPLPTGTWTHIAISYNATYSASGMALSIDGVSCGEVLRDRLTKDPGHGGHGITVGQRFRDRGLGGGRIDDLKVYDRALSSVERAHLFDGTALDSTLLDRDRSALLGYFLAAVDPRSSEARRAVRDANAQLLSLRNAVVEISVMEDLPTPTPAYVLNRGAYDAPKTKENRAPREPPGALPRMDDALPRDRLGLAKWLTHPNHPLLARVNVNRFWQMFFGSGLVESSDNFGRQGSAPSHPQLLDWLARDFIEAGWDVKRLCKQIVLSATYRQDSAVTAELLRRDPANRLLARGPSHRLPAEMIRDTALFAAGLLDERPGGPPVSPYQPVGLWRESNSMSPAYRQSVDKDLYRRSVYTVWKRTAPIPNMLAFDAANREVCVVRRQPTNTPIQALVLMNDVQFVEAARRLASRSFREGEPGVDPYVLAFRLATGRTPSPHTVRILSDLFLAMRLHFLEDEEAARALIGFGETPPGDLSGVADLAAMTMVTQTILNLDAVVWKR